MTSGHRHGASRGHGYNQQPLPRLQDILSRPEPSSPQLPSLPRINTGYSTSAVTSPVLSANYHPFAMNAQHPPSPSTTDSEGPEYTPASSRRGSSSGPGLSQYRSASRHSSSSSRTAKRTTSSRHYYSHGSDHSSSGHRIKEEQKRTHERKARADQCAVLQDMEDAFNILLAWSCGKNQSTGNGFSSGLVGDKLANSQAGVTLLTHLLQEKIRQGLTNGNLAQVQAELRAVCDRGVNHPRGPLADTWLDTGLDNDDCITIKNSDKECHNPNHEIRFSDARDCRKSRRTATFLTRLSDEFQGNKQALRAQLDPAIGIIGQKFSEVVRPMGEMLGTIENTIPRKR